MTEMGEMKEKELLVLRTVHQIGKEARTHKNGGWVKSGWILGGLKFPIHPQELLRIARSIESQGRVQIRRNRNPRVEARVLPRAFECRIPQKRTKRVKRK